jgi:hypothetical protein
MFLGEPPDLGCVKTADGNGDEGLDLSDAVVLLNHLFLGGRVMPPPSTCGGDTRPGGLSCLSFGGCLQDR